MFEVKLPVIKDYSVSILDFKAVEGGMISNTKAINDAICHVCNQGGGHVIIPKGMWLTGPIELLSNVDLVIDKDAYVLFTKDIDEYPLILTDYEGQPRVRCVSPIYAKNAQNFSITGKGILDGNGELWRPLKENKVTRKQWIRFLKQRGEHLIPTKEGFISYPSKESYEAAMRGEIENPNLVEERKYFEYYRPVFVSLIECDTVLIDGVTLQNSPAWNVHPLFCKNFTLRNAMIKNAEYAQNGDGIDLESCTYSQILDTTFDVGDDGICLKSGKNAIARKIKRPTEHILIQGCKVYAAHGGFVIGSEMSRGVNNVIVKDCVFMGSDIGIRVKSQLGRGGDVCNISIENVRMHNIIEEAILFTMGYQLFTMEHERPDVVKTTDLEDVPAFYDFYIKDVVCDNAKIGLKINGLPEKKIHNINLEQVLIKSEIGIQIDNAYDIHLKDTIIHNNSQQMAFKDETIDDTYKPVF